MSYVCNCGRPFNSPEERTVHSVSCPISVIGEFIEQASSPHELGVLVLDWHEKALKLAIKKLKKTLLTQTK